MTIVEIVVKVIYMTNTTCNGEAKHNVHRTWKFRMLLRLLCCIEFSSLSIALNESDLFWRVKQSIPACWIYSIFNYGQCETNLQVV